MTRLYAVLYIIDKNNEIGTVFKWQVINVHESFFIRVFLLRISIY